MIKCAPYLAITDSGAGTRDVFRFSSFSWREFSLQLLVVLEKASRSTTVTRVQVARVCDNCKVNIVYWECSMSWDIACEEARKQHKRVDDRDMERGIDRYITQRAREATAQIKQQLAIRSTMTDIFAAAIARGNYKAIDGLRIEKAIANSPECRN